ncbi:hypothetical protein [Methylococcus sp. EFPC2]|uniref:hypothetical protein n=1 Tax=Methylococcus sp. EFPC2 TaxID=2812648 RepID=UPI0019685BF7|nr:hypothetical protein [Methylococcus sp. EFPC2]QSA96162.1 hypothetical protein JWZ97_13085 [Methylococcus sp. EFPC2]
MGRRNKGCRFTAWVRVIGTVLFAGSTDLPALDLGSTDRQLHGFVSQGFVYTTKNQLFGESRKGSVDFTEVGVNASARLLPNLRMSAQGLYRRAGNSDTQGLRLDFAQLDYSLPFLDSSATAGVRAGRVKVPFGLYNDTRDVIWTRPTVLLPQSVYFDTLGLRQAMIAADGGELYGRYSFGEHSFGAELMVAEPQYDTGGATTFLTGLPNATGSLTGRPALIGRAVYEWMGGRGRLMFTAVDLDIEFKSGSAAVPSGKIAVIYPLFSMQYNGELFSLTSEYGWIDSRRSGFVPTPLSNTTESFYVQGEYRVASNWTAVLRYDEFHVNRDDPNGKTGSALTGLPRHRFYAKDVTVGARWEFVRDWLIAAEYHHIDGTAWLSTEDNPSLARGGGSADWDMLTLMMSYRF